MKKSFWVTKLGIGLLFAVVLIFWVASYFVIVGFGFSSAQTSSELGDSFGAVSALFSGLAFAGLIITLILQREELSQNTEALKLQAEELKLTREEVEKQV